MLTFPNAKINLGLRILRKRPDGFHEIDSCFYPVNWKEALEIIPSESFAFSTSGIEIDAGNKTGVNLCEQAYQLLAADFDMPAVNIHLHKSIPIGAGLGGGSADASFTLKMLNELFNLGITTSQLEAYAAALGSDCPFFIQNKPVIAGGRGEEFSPVSLSLKGCYLVMAYPNIHISTKEAYQGVSPQIPEHSCQEILSTPLENWKETLKNDFESSLFPKYPLLSKLKESFYEKGAVYASMTGSGSTIFGLFRQDPNWKSWNWEHQMQGGKLY